MKQRTMTVETEGFSDVVDISDEIDSFLSEVGGEGLLNICIPGSTAVVTTIEYESGCVEDLQRALEDIAPRDRTYKHNEKWGDGNGFSHLRAALMDPEVTMPFKNGSLQNGTWQQVVVVDHDNNPRSREVLLTALSG